MHNPLECYHSGLVSVSGDSDALYRRHLTFNPLSPAASTRARVPAGTTVKGFLFPFESLLLALFLSMHSARLQAQAPPPAAVEGPLPPDEVPGFDAVRDPMEGFNRCCWQVNDWLFRDLLYPMSLVYNFAMPKPARTMISNGRHNLTFPVRLFNSGSEGKWRGVWAETARFGVNSTVGLGGLFDPATHWGIGRCNRDFGETLGKWGSGPGYYLVLPLVGPSNGRDAIGTLVDLPLDISFWFGCAYPHDFWPNVIQPGGGFNSLSGNARDYKRQLDSFADPYEALRTLYSLNRQRLILDYTPSSQTNDAPNPTIRSVLFKPLTPGFADQAVTRRVRVPATGKKLAYSCWMQPKPAPLVFYIPGLGAYRLDRSTLAYADMMYRHGFSVVTFSSPFQKEFMESASTMSLPGYAPVDCDDVVNVLKLISADLRHWQGGRITGTSLTGVSHGGYFTLMIAARETAGELGGLSFDRYVAVNPPRQLAHAAQLLDEMFDAPLAWPADERRKKMEESVHKALFFADNGLDVSGTIPLSRAESDFLIGLTFRHTLINAIVDSQRRNNLGVLKVNPAGFVRQDSYREIRRVNYAGYTERFVLPYLIKTGRVTSREQLLANTDLTQSTESLRHNPKIRVQICEDDFLLTPTDLPWFRSTFATNLTDYPAGGHLGNLHIPAVQERLVQLFSHHATEDCGRLRHAKAPAHH